MCRGRSGNSRHRSRPWSITVTQYSGLGAGVIARNDACSAAGVFAHADIRARFLVDETLAELATHIANLAILIDPARIAVGGGLMSSGDVILRALSFRLGYAVPFPPEIVPARFLNDASLYGAIALALTVPVPGGSLGEM